MIFREKYLSDSENEDYWDFKYHENHDYIDDNTGDFACYMEGLYTHEFIENGRIREEFEILEIEEKRLRTNLQYDSSSEEDEDYCLFNERDLFKTVFTWKYYQFEEFISKSFLSKLKPSDLEVLLACLLESNWTEKEKAIKLLVKRIHELSKDNQLVHLIRNFVQKCFKKGEIQIVQKLKESKLIEFFYPEPTNAVQLLSRVHKFPHPIHDFLIEMFNVWEYDKPLDRNMSPIMSSKFPWNRLHILENALNLTYNLAWAVDNAISMLDIDLLAYLINQHSREQVESCINYLDIVKICSRDGFLNELSDEFASFCISIMSKKFSFPFLNIQFVELDYPQIIPVVALKIAVEVGLNEQFTKVLIEQSCKKLKRWNIYQNCPNVLDDSAKCLAIALTYGVVTDLDVFNQADMNFCLELFANSDETFIFQSPIDESIVSFTCKCLAIAFGYGFQFNPFTLDRFIKLYSNNSRLIKLIQTSIQPSFIKPYLYCKQYKHLDILLGKTNRMENLSSLCVTCIRYFVKSPLHLVVKKLIGNGYIPTPIGDILLQKALLIKLAGGPFRIETRGSGTVTIDGIYRLFSKRDY
ncbi:DgyrCDS8320 [Dimorphilus gyrociliatus]|uniref:DgyrCDS8320 n=1 Tax=Dimorphilus gyrociliatus TaxID=2664684 RepID=A0A7I8VVC9_9ANNE|nr:DgyrCDS8320 [Dimorphilus gyrociliatus]